jgi:3-dehydroquinate synthase
MSRRRVITVPTRDGGYEVVIEPGLLPRVGAGVAEAAPDSLALLAVDERIADEHGRVVRESMEAAGFETATVALLANEHAKTLDVVAALYRRMLEHGLERSSPLVAVGGGIVGDTAGFAAATYLRGIPFVNVPTTLLAMVDAAIGGKTAVNFPLPAGGLGKNLIGAFWQPRAVLVDPECLRTLSKRDLRCGLAECVKSAVIADPALLEFLHEEAERLDALESDALLELIERSVRIKAAVVASDEREAGERARLNLGHTFAHALEAQPDVDVRHGEAVSIGLVAAAHCAGRVGRLDAEGAGRITATLERLQLPVELPRPVDLELLMEAMRYDKKKRAGRMLLVVPVGLGDVEITDDVPEDVVRDAWVAVGAGR